MTAYTGTVKLQPKTGVTGGERTLILSYVRSGTNNAAGDTIAWANPFKGEKVKALGGFIFLNAMDSNASPAAITLGTYDASGLSGSVRDADGLLVAKSAGFSSATANNVLFYTLDGALLNSILAGDDTIVATLGTIGTALAGAKIHIQLTVEGV